MRDKGREPWAEWAQQGSPSRATPDDCWSGTYGRGTAGELWPGNHADSQDLLPVVDRLRELWAQASVLGSRSRDDQQGNDRATGGSPQGRSETVSRQPRLPAVLAGSSSFELPNHCCIHGQSSTNGILPSKGMFFAPSWR